jgi:L-amino acid N-acyltransferase
VKLINCDETHRDAIRSILNDAIENSTAVYDYEPRTTAVMDEWFAAKRRGQFPVIGMLSEDGQLMGFASYGTFRAWAGYKYTVEHSLYVAEPFRGRGVGTALLRELIHRAQQQGYHVLVGGIDSLNASSIRLHERFGFQLSATMPQVGFKFGRWLDLHFYQLILETPQEPSAG